MITSHVHNFAIPSNNSTLIDIQNLQHADKPGRFWQRSISL